MASAQVVIPVCDLCGSHSDVAWFCVECGETMCQRCKIAHSNGKKTKNDRVISLSEAKSVGVIGIAKQEMCKDHPNKVADIYCDTCKTLVCNKCLSDDHKHHEWTHLEEANKKARKNAEDSMEGARTKLQEIETAAEMNNTAIKKFNTVIGTCKDAITKRGKDLKSAIDVACEMRNAQLEDFRKVETEELEKIINENKTQMDITSQYITKLENSLKDSGFPNLSELPSDDYRAVISLLEPRICVDPKQIKFIPGSASFSDVEDMFGCIDIDATQELQTGSCYLNSRDTVVERSFNTPGTSIVRTICPKSDGTAWILYDRDRWAYLIDMDGELLKRVDFGQTLADATLSKLETLYLSLLSDKRVRYLSPEGAIGTLVTFTHDTKGICAHNDNIFVCVCKPERSEIHVISDIGYRKRIISPSLPGLSSLVLPGRLTVLPNERIAVIDWNDNVNVKVFSFDQEGNHVMEKRLKTHNTSGLFDLTCDDEGHIYITDFVSNAVHKIIGTTGSELNIAKFNVKVPSGIVFIKPSTLWIGGKDGMIHEIRY